MDNPGEVLNDITVSVAPLSMAASISTLCFVTDGVYALRLSGDERVELVLRPVKACIFGTTLVTSETAFFPLAFVWQPLKG